MNKLKQFFKLYILPLIIMFVVVMVSMQAYGKEGEYFHSCEYPDRQTELTSLACNVYFEGRCGS